MGADFYQDTCFYKFDYLFSVPGFVDSFCDGLACMVARCMGASAGLFGFRQDAAFMDEFTIITIIACAFTVVLAAKVDGAIASGTRNLLVT